MEINRKIEHFTEAVHATQAALNAVEIPTNGSFQEMHAIGEIKKSYQFELRRFRNDLKQWQQAREKAQKLLKHAHLEHEKARHLDEMETRQILDKRKKIEEAELGELGVMLFNNQRENA